MEKRNTPGPDNLKGLNADPSQFNQSDFLTQQDIQVNQAQADMLTNPQANQGNAQETPQFDRGLAPKDIEAEIEKDLAEAHGKYKDQPKRLLIDFETSSYIPRATPWLVAAFVHK